MTVTAEAARRADFILERLGLTWRDLTEQLSDFCPVGRVAAEVVADLRFRRQVQRLHALGPRVTAELLAELGAERGIQTIIDRKIDIYTRLDPETLGATSGDKFWPAPLHKVPRS